MAVAMEVAAENKKLLKHVKHLFLFLSLTYLARAARAIIVRDGKILLGKNLRSTLSMGCGVHLAEQLRQANVTFKIVYSR